MQLLIAGPMVGITIIMHLAGLALLVGMIRRHTLDGDKRRARMRQLVTILGAAFGLFALHTVEIWLYAALYVGVHALHNFDDSLYFSTTTYTTLGYGDVILPKKWRLVGAIESANGIILLGWSTAFFVSVINRIRLFEHELAPDD